MKTKKPNRSNSITQAALFPDQKAGRKLTPGQCEVVAVGKRRDGGIRYWCLRHKADATAKYGKPATRCRASHIPPISSQETFTLNLDKYIGGVALWGAVPAVYDTTTLPMDRGIHVHARLAADAEKEMDCTFRAVRIVGERLPEEGIFITELDAIYYMVSSVFGHGMRHVTCSQCGYAHLDRDWFSVHPHRRHLCAGCGKYFRDNETAVGNPILGARSACHIEPRTPTPSPRTLNIKQSDFPGGIQIWGSNAAFIWTGKKSEEEGVHVHAFRAVGGKPEIDETYGEVTIDDTNLDPVMVRVLMAQETMPSLKNRVVSADCPRCSAELFSVGELAFTPVVQHRCQGCNQLFTTAGRIRKTVANPLVGTLAHLSQSAPREPQQQDLGLVPETL